MFSRNIKLSLCLVFLFLLSLPTSTFSVPEKFQQLITAGELTEAQHLMRVELATNFDLSLLEREEISFEIERLERIKKDFTKSHQEVVEYIQNYLPEVSEREIAQWEKEKSLEYMIIDGEKRYFIKAAANLFLIDKEAVKRKTKKPRIFNRLQDIKKVIALAQKSGQMYVKPERVRITYTLSVEENAVPEGKTIRCWLPFPREIPHRQVNVVLLFTDPERYLIADNEDYPQRTIYLEKKAMRDQKTVFKIAFEFTEYAVYQVINPDKVKPARLTEELKPFLEERPPHVVFTEELQALSQSIVGQETNPYLKAKKIFQWINDHIPWASAREYSTIRNISSYCYQNGHGDCGIKTLLFLTLCRMNGIPAKWQSGWTTEPGGGMHDWGEVYFEPYGWVPVDISYGLQESPDQLERWFYLGSMDGYRLIINDDYAQELYPAKVHFRSETVDFQRGEVEWQGGNLYFVNWDYQYQADILH